HQSGRPDRLLAAACQAIGAVADSATLQGRPRLLEDIAMGLRLQRQREQAEAGRLEVGRLVGGVAPAPVGMCLGRKAVKVGTNVVHEETAPEKTARNSPGKFSTRSAFEPPVSTLLTIPSMRKKCPRPGTIREYDSHATGSGLQSPPRQRGCFPCWRVGPRRPGDAVLAGGYGCDWY